jgi:hypothetical protein
MYRLTRPGGVVVPTTNDPFRMTWGEDGTATSSGTTSPGGVNGDVVGWNGLSFQRRIGPCSCRHGTGLGQHSRSRSYRDVEERSAERGITVDHVTVYRFEAVWLVCKSPLGLEAPQLAHTSLPPSAAQKRSACRTSLSRTWCGRTMLYSMGQTSMAVRAVARSVACRGPCSRVASGSWNQSWNQLQDTVAPVDVGDDFWPDLPGRCSSAT